MATSPRAKRSDRAFGIATVYPRPDAPATRAALGAFPSRSSRCQDDGAMRDSVIGLIVARVVAAGVPGLAATVVSR
jgi:hypothetical protein